MAGHIKYSRTAWLLPFGVALVVAADSRAAPPSEAQWAEPTDPQAAPSPDDEALLEFHFNPTANLQIAIWLEGADGTFLDDVFVTQSTAKLGIGNRSGDFLFLSSWRAPYGPRESVLPIWAHRRGKTYPKIIFHDANTSNHTSLGFHESSSSPETYFCRPLTPTEDDAIIDTMTCPSPATFQSDKGEFEPGETSIYPPRNDLTNFDDPGDGPDPVMYAELNELDMVSRATPVAGQYLFAHRIRRGDVPEGPIVAWIEVSLERDENPDWEFDREDDHWVDPKLPNYGREFLGQPAVVYRVEFDPAVPGYTSVTQYEGYADWDGATGTVHPPDSTISSSNSSGADRLRMHDEFGESARFGIYNHGWESMSGDGDGDGDGDSGEGDGDSGSGSDSDTGNEGGGGGCTTIDLPPVEDLILTPTAFNEVTATFTLPEVPDGIQLSTLYAAWITPETDDFQLGSAKDVSGIPRLCRDAGEVGCIDAGPGDEISITIDQLFGNYTYTIGVFVEDVCTNRSEIAVGEVTTPVQPFQTIEGACFVATAAWGAGWTDELRVLRAFRDGFMVDTPIAADLVRTYYAYGPVLANMIRDVPPARAAARLLLRPVVGVAKHAVATRW
jgi:hypothetical protein